MQGIPTFHLDLKHKCEICVEVKMIRPSFHLVERSNELLSLIHTDVCEVKGTSTRCENKYFIIFIDNNTKYSCVYLLKSKDQDIEKFILYKNEVENQLNKKIKVVQRDRGYEYVSPFIKLCTEHEIRHETTTPYIPRQNRVIEQKNHILKEMINALLLSYKLLEFMWGKLY